MTLAEAYVPADTALHTIKTCMSPHG